MILFVVLVLLGIAFFFDYFYVIIFLLLNVCLFTFGGTEFFSGVFFFDSLSFSLVFLSLLIFFYCFMSSFLDFWVSNFFSSFMVLLGGLYFFLFISFSCFSVFLFYVSFEFMFLMMYIFLLNWGYSPERLQASIYMIFYTVVVSFPFLVYISVVSKEESGIFGLFVTCSFYWWPFFILVFLVKLPVYGAHLWLPKAHVEAPVSGSMLLAGVLLKLGGYGLIRFSYCLISSISIFKGYLVSLGLLGGMLSCFLCLRQSDLKAFVAYSSVCHMGFALSGLCVGMSCGYSGGLWMLLSHGFCSSCLFYILYVFYERFYSRSMIVLKGLGTVIPMLGLTWFLFSVINMGVPPFFSFFSEVLILSSLSSSSIYSFFFSGVLLFFAGIYCIFLFIICFHGASKGEGLVSLVGLREHLSFYSHFYYLVYFLLLFSFFF